MYKPLLFEIIPLPNNGDWDSYMNHENAEFKRVNDHAIENGTRVGMTFRIPCADSYAHYQVIGQTKHTYRVAWLEIGDAWNDHYFGQGGKFPKETVDRHIDREQALRRIFSK